MTWALYAALSALFAAVTAILAKVGVAGISSNLATAIRTVVVIIFAWGIVLADGSYKQMGSLSRSTIIFLVLSGVATGLSWLFYFRALQLGEAAKVAPIDKFSLILTIIFAGIFLHEKITPAIAFGAVLMTIGTLIITFAR